MRRWLAEIIAAPLLPLLIYQGRRTRTRTLRLPETDGASNGLYGQCGKCNQDGMCPSTPLKLLAVGESPIAGVGVADHGEAITAKLGAEIARRAACHVDWTAYGKNGATVAEAIDELLPRIPPGPVDVLFVAFGVNDTTAFRKASAFREDMTRLLDILQARCPPRITLLSGVPPLGHFPALPQPLAAVLGCKAAALDREAMRLAKERLATVHVPLGIDIRQPGLMACDGYHPSAKGCDIWASQLAERCFIRPHGG